MITFFGLAGVFCLAVVAVMFFTTGIKFSFGKQLNSNFFQPKADAEVDRLIQKGVITSAQEPDIRGLIRRIYVPDCVILIYGLGAGLLGIGIAFIAFSFSLWISYKLSRIRLQNTG